MMTEQGNNGMVAKDPRFDQWARLILKAEYEQDGVRKSCWPGMWPLDRKDRDADPKMKGFVSLEEIREMIGSQNYMAEYLAQPGESEDLHFGDVTKEKHGWWLESPDALFDSDPKNSTSVICWRGKDDKEEKMVISDFLKDRVKLFITVDTSYTATSDSDYKVCTLMGYDPIDASLFVMDTWGAQCRESVLIEKSFAMAGRWGCPSIHPEVVRQSFGLYTSMESMVRQKAVEVTGGAQPRIVPLKMGMLDKTSKINSLHYRFEHGLIKFPVWRRGQLPWRLLFDQIEQFNPDAENGGLQHDDFIDTVAMSMFVVRGRLDRQLVGEEGRVLDYDQMLQDGTIHDQGSGGVPMVEGMNFSNVNVGSIINALEVPPNAKRGSRV
jgi:phage terminase large subunit-like protein